MALVRFDPFAELAAWQRDVGRAAGDSFVPAADIHRTDEAFIIRLDMPGVVQDDVQVTVEDGRMTISAERPHDVKVDEASWVRRERRMGRFARSFTLPEGADADMITANLEHGVLELRIPHAPERQPRQIPVTATA